MNHEKNIEPGTNLQPLISAVTPAASLAKSEGLAEAYARIQVGEPLPALAKRVAETDEIARFDQEITQLSGGRAEDLLSKKIRDVPDVSTKLAEVLIRSSMNRPIVIPSLEVRRAIEEQISIVTHGGAPLVVAIPLGGAKAPVSLKTGGTEMPDDAERLMLAHLAGLVTAMRTAYERSYVLIVPDAPLHADLGFESATVSSHVNRLRTLISLLGFDGLVFVADTAGLVPGDLYVGTIEDGEHEVIRRARASVDEAQNLVAQFRSLQFVVRPPLLALDEAVWFYGGLAYGTAAVPPATVQQIAQFRDKVLQATVRMAAVNSFGLREPINLVRRAVNEMFGTATFVRATVHPKAGEIRPLLRNANKFDSPGLLPMHGLGFRVTTERNEIRWGMTFAIDGRMQGWTAVYDQQGQFRHFEAKGVKTQN